MDLEPFIGGKIEINTLTLKALHIVKVPYIVYQCVYDIAQIQGATEESKWQVMKVLEEWIEESYPGYRMVASIELSYAEAKAAQNHYPGIEWGIYIKIAPCPKRLE